jgi:hypothetical protein
LPEEILSASLPFSLLLAWILFFGFLNTHQRHAANFRGGSQGFSLALNISVIVGSLCGLGILGYYFVQAAWYWPLVLFLIGSLCGGLIFGWLDAALGQLRMTVISFIGWPLSAAWCFFLVRGLAP